MPRQYKHSAGFSLFYTITGFLLLLAALLFGLSFQARADDAVIAAASTVTTTDFTGTANSLIAFLVAIFGTGATVLLKRMATSAVNLHLLQANQVSNAAIEAAITRAEGWAIKQVEAIVDPQARVDMHSAVAAQAAELVKDLVPTAIAASGLDTSTIQTRIRMALGDPTLGATPQPAATVQAAPAPVATVSIADTGAASIAKAIVTILLTIGLLSACTKQQEEQAMQVGCMLDGTVQPLTAAQKAGLPAGFATLSADQQLAHPVVQAVCAAINAQPAPATLAPSGGSAPPPAIGAPAAPAGT